MEAALNSLRRYVMNCGRSTDAASRSCAHRASAVCSQRLTRESNILAQRSSTSGTRSCRPICTNAAGSARTLRRTICSICHRRHSAPLTKATTQDAVTNRSEIVRRQTYHSPALCCVGQHAGWRPPATSTLQRSYCWGLQERRGNR
jgi:hypothetical protein